MVAKDARPLRDWGWHKMVFLQVSQMCLSELWSFGVLDQVNTLAFLVK